MPNCLKKQNNKTTKITVKYKTEEKNWKYKDAKIMENKTHTWRIIYLPQVWTIETRHDITASFVLV